MYHFAAVLLGEKWADHVCLVHVDDSSYDDASVMSLFLYTTTTASTTIYARRTHAHTHSDTHSRSLSFSLCLTHMHPYVEANMS